MQSFMRLGRQFVGQCTIGCEFQAVHDFVHLLNHPLPYALGRSPTIGGAMRSIEPQPAKRGRSASPKRAARFGLLKVRVPATTGKKESKPSPGKAPRSPKPGLY
jgi:hypothetical protein